MPACKYCGEPIRFRQRSNGSWEVLEPDGAKHGPICKRRLSDPAVFKARMSDPQKFKTNAKPWMIEFSASSNGFVSVCGRYAIHNRRAKDGRPLWRALKLGEPSVDLGTEDTLDRAKGLCEIHAQLKKVS